MYLITIGGWLLTVDLSTVNSYTLYVYVPNVASEFRYATESNCCCDIISRRSRRRKAIEAYSRRC